MLFLMAWKVSPFPHSFYITYSLLLTTLLTFSQVKGWREADEVYKKDLRSSFLWRLYLTDDPEKPQVHNCQVRQSVSRCIANHKMIRLIAKHVQQSPELLLPHSLPSPCHGTLSMVNYTEVRVITHVQVWCLLHIDHTKWWAEVYLFTYGKPVPIESVLGLWYFNLTVVSTGWWCDICLSGIYIEQLNGWLFGNQSEGLCCPMNKQIKNLLEHAAF